VVLLYKYNFLLIFFFSHHNSVFASSCILIVFAYMMLVAELYVISLDSAKVSAKV